jgi:phosphonate transport system substrate-binding protein
MVAVALSTKGIRMRILLFMTTVYILSTAGCSPRSKELPRAKSTLTPEGDIARTNPNVLTLGVVPQQSPADIERNWSGLARYLETRLGKTVLIKTASSIPEFERRCGRGLYDIAYMNPYHLTVFCERPGYRAMVKQNNKSIIGILVVRKDSPFAPIDSPQSVNLKKFQGKKVAFPSPAAFAASLLTRAEFKRQNVDIIPHYVLSHDSVYQNVKDGHFLVGGGVIRTLKSMPPDVQDELRILWTSKPYTPHALAAHPRLSDQEFKRIQSALCSADLSAPTSEWRSKALTPLCFNGFIVAENADWNDVRRLGLSELEIEVE